ncbi:relaxase domain-containing protein [Propioniciclava sp. MC1595]|uniref:MobF family relaxase n=2 Tax=unclassified Propioniciclava TaxID=2642922 RepID=UPI001662671F|nr:MobF family relaxase [Propioniciclava sp. MC1595]MBB1496099.1 relaxase domain-containing protein [Propioniciclava sp. MC1595]QTE26656.1 relaxase domain-containing protein [Propioniciclava sp. MC1595]
MSLHKLTAGDGYEYLTRQVAAMDSTEKGHTGLASYYTQKGETPGVWVGSGMAGIEGLDAGDRVTAEQMRFLFGSGHHPLARQRGEALPPDATVVQARDAIRLGQPFKVYAHDMPEFRIEVAKRFAAYNAQVGAPQDAPVPAQVRAAIRTQVGRETYRATFGRDPVDARELAGLIATASRPQTTAVAGYDLTFSPVKSVSTLWALADPSIAATIERAHLAAIGDALRFIETHALYTRTGHNGVRQVDVTGLVAARFTHRDSRAGDPDLHTHVPVANKVQTLDGRWLSIDGRLLFKAIVAASEVYNTALERRLSEALPVRFAERPSTDPGKRPVRELVGVDPALNARWSQRRASIEHRQSELTAAFQREHHRPPTMVEARALAQQANLETRQAKHEPRTLAEQRATWRTEAEAVLGADGVRSMLTAALTARTLRRPTFVTRSWMRTQSVQIVATMEGSRSTWQDWHVRAEALRVVRAANVPRRRVDDVVARLTHAALTRHSVALKAPADGIAEPAALRRTDGDSVYSVARSTWHTSRRIVAAEHRLVDAAGRRGGHRVPTPAVEVALIEAVANRTPLNPGQVALVREMATSGARLQLAIAPAGSGKTTAMRALSTAWRNGGGTVVGLAPSAAAAAQLGAQIDTHADTMALLTHALNHRRPLPAWAERIGPTSLVIIDEAGMADTLSLDQVVEFVLDRGGSVRLIGDDQQLAAIGAGGVLRDIQATHGAVQLNELVRFADPAEGAASLALRAGDPEALGFYLDNHRVHVGDLGTSADQVFDSWLTARQTGADALMVAPTRALVAELNARAQADLRGGVRPTRLVALADGSDAAVGDVIITRLNDRRLRTSGTDWVRNGDRWTITGIATNGDLRAIHQTNRQTVILPAAYVTESVELGYACTIHGAQGVTADVLHGIATGAETRQQLYTMLTRGRYANHVHLEVVGDGDAHSLIRPEAIIPPTATDLLERILARDEDNTSATTTARTLADPAHRLADAVARYSDALGYAAEQTAGADLSRRLEQAAGELVDGLTDAPAWPTLRAHLLLIAASGTDPVLALTEAVQARELGSAADPAAVIDWRLEPVTGRDTQPAPLPWLPGLPTSLGLHRDWGGYLQRRHALVVELADQVRDQALAATQLPAWAPAGSFRPDAATVADLTVWRAAHRTPATDTRPTGERQFSAVEARWQARLDRRIIDHLAPAVAEWTPLLHQLAPAADRDPYLPVLAHRLAQISGVGLDAHRLLIAATNEGQLPDDHAASALWWRICRHLTPAVATQLADQHSVVTTSWLADLEQNVGRERASALQASPWWPALVVSIEQALARGWQLTDLISTPESAVDIDDCQALVWRTSVLLDPLPDSDDLPPDPADAAPDEHWTPRADLDHAAGATMEDNHIDEVEPNLAFTFEAIERRVMTPPEISAADLNAQLDRADAWRASPHTPERLAAVNELALEFYQDRYRGSWAQPYLAGRFGADLTDDPDVRPGYAPAGWTSLVSHLHRHGVTDEELLAAGLAVTASTGRLIDRFRDRAVFPIVHDQQVVGFVGRRHPDATDLDHAGPKYLNTAETLLFHKRAQLFVAGARHLDAGGIPVVVEGPADAIAVTRASEGRYVGVAPLGTNLTSEQATQLRGYGVDPIIATDADVAGQVAAQRDYWILTPQLLQPRYAALPDGSDPADLVATGSAPHLVDALDQARPLAGVLIDERLANLPPIEAALAAAPVIAAQSVDAWEPAVHTVAEKINVDADVIRSSVQAFIRAWNNDPVRLADQQVSLTAQVRDRLTAAGNARRWETFASRLDPRLVADPHWRTLASTLHDAHSRRVDVPDAITVALEEGPLNADAPADDLASRLARITHPEPFSEPAAPMAIDAPNPHIPERQYLDRGPMAP